MGGWLAGLDAFAVGLAYLGALLTTRFVLRPLLVGVLGGAPVVGGWLSGSVDSSISAFERNITPAANASMGTLVSALDWLTVHSRAILGGVSSLGGEIYNALWRVVSYAIPSVAESYLNYAEGLITAARGYALSLFQRAEADGAQAVRAAEVVTQNLVGQAEAGARAEISVAEGVVLQEIRKVEQATGALFRQAEYDAQQGVALVEREAMAAVQGARQDLGAAVGAVEHDVERLGKAVGVAIADTTSVLGGDIQAAEARAQAAIDALGSVTGKSLEGIIDSPEWQLLKALTGSSDALLKAAGNEIIAATFKALRERIAQLPALRAQAEPILESVLSSLKANLG